MDILLKMLRSIWDEYILKQSISLIYTTAGLKSEICSRSSVSRVNHIVLLKLEQKILPRKPWQCRAWKILTLAVSTNLNYTYKRLYKLLSTSLNTMILIHGSKKRMYEGITINMHLRSHIYANIYSANKGVRAPNCRSFERHYSC